MIEFLNSQPDIFLGLRIIHVLMLIPTIIMIYVIFRNKY